MKYDELIEKLSKLPQINSFCVYDGDEPALRDGKAIEAQLIKFNAPDIDAAKERMVHEVMTLISGKSEVWVRVMPEIKLRTDDETGEPFVSGYTRIAVA